MFVVLEYDKPGTPPSVVWGVVYTEREDAAAAAEEQDFDCRVRGKTSTHAVASLVAA